PIPKSRLLNVAHRVITGPSFGHFLATSLSECGELYRAGSPRPARFFLQPVRMRKPAAGVTDSDTSQVILQRARLASSDQMRPEAFYPTGQSQEDWKGRGRNA